MWAIYTVTWDCFQKSQWSAVIYHITENDQTVSSIKVQFLQQNAQNYIILYFLHAPYSFITNSLLELMSLDKCFEALLANTILLHQFHTSWTDILHYNDIPATLLNELKSVDENILKLSDNKLINLLLLWWSSIDSKTLGYWMQQLSN